MAREYSYTNISSKEELGINVQKLKGQISDFNLDKVANKTSSFSNYGEFDLSSVGMMIGSKINKTNESLNSLVNKMEAYSNGIKELDKFDINEVEGE